MRKLFAFILIVVLMMGFSVTVTASSDYNRRLGAQICFQCLNYCPFMDIEGNFLNDETVKENIQALFDAGRMSRHRKNQMLERLEIGVREGRTCQGGNTHIKPAPAQQTVSPNSPNSPNSPGGIIWTNDPEVLQAINTGGPTSGGIIRREDSITFGAVWIIGGVPGRLPHCWPGIPLPPDWECECD